MRLVLQRVSRASVEVEAETVGAIGRGFVVLVAVAPQDDAQDVAWCARKILQLRVFGDESGRMNLSLQDIGGEILLISQFTLLGNTRKGNRPSFSAAAPPGHADEIFQALLKELRKSGLIVQTGVFGAMMEVKLNNHGPVTLIVDSTGTDRN